MRIQKSDWYFKLLRKNDSPICPAILSVEFHKWTSALGRLLKSEELNWTAALSPLDDIETILRVTE